MISADEFDGYGLATVAPITRAERNYPTHVPVGVGLSGLHVRGFIQVEQLRTVSSARLVHRLGTAGGEMPAVERILTLILGLGR